MIRTIVGAAAALAAALAGAGPTLAASTDPASGRTGVAVSQADASRTGTTVSGSTHARAPRARLTLTYMADAGYATAVKLTCAPTGGGHPEAALACATLRTTGVNPDKIKPAQVMCMMLYAPITAQMTGVWRGARVKWSHKYGNSCEMTRATGVLFKF